MDHHVAVVREESERFLEALAAVPPDRPVPTCPGWTAGDLAYHLAEVQHSWAQVVAAGAVGDDVEPPARPDDAAGLRDLVATHGTALVTALATTPPGTPCWSWHPEGGTVGWVARRQAHEALVHRVDAELTAGRPVTPPLLRTAVDGVDEVLRVMVDGVPPWGAFAPDGVTVRLACTDDDAAWTLALGRFTGTSPRSGRTYDLDAAQVLDTAQVLDAGGAGRDVTATIAGHAWDLDLWLWGRGGAEGLTVDGDARVAERLRALVSESTQ